MGLKKFCCLLCLRYFADFLWDLLTETYNYFIKKYLYNLEYAFAY